MLAQNNQLWLLFIDDSFQQFGYDKRLYLPLRIDLDAAVGAERQCSADLFLAAFVANLNGNHFRRNSRFFQAYRLFNGNFTKGVDGHLDVIKVNIATIGFGAYLHVVINDALYGNTNLHGFSIDI